MHALVGLRGRVWPPVSLEPLTERVLERVVLDHGLDQDEGVQLWHRADRVVDFHLRDLHQLAVLLLRGKRIHPVAGHPIVRLEEDQIGPSAHEKKSEANIINVLSYDVNYLYVENDSNNVKAHWYKTLSFTANIDSTVYSTESCTLFVLG